MNSEHLKWNDAKDKAYEVIKQNDWEKDIRFMMALRNALQEKILKIQKELTNSFNKQKEV